VSRPLKSERGDHLSSLSRLLGLVVCLVLIQAACAGIVVQDENHCESSGDQNSSDDQNGSYEIGTSARTRLPIIDLSGYNAGFTKVTMMRNAATGELVEESYLYGDNLDRESRIEMDGNGSSMKVDSNFDGTGHIGVFKMAQPNGSAQDGLAFEASEDYSGNFRIYENIESFGTNVESDRSVSGDGYVAVNKKIGTDQRIKESGTGTYRSDEQIRSDTSYIAKDISLESGPVSQSLGDDLVINQNLKWRECISSRSEGTSFMGEEYSEIERLDKVTVVRGLSDMETDAKFSGKARYRLLEDQIEMDDQYEGDYSLQRKMRIQTTSRYNQPHLKVTKECRLVFKEDRTLASYIISVENDGDRTLEPIHIIDIFPPGATFVNTTMRPELSQTSANWTLTHLSVGEHHEIWIWLDVTECNNPEIVNRVEAAGGYDGGWIKASNFSAIEMNWLTCCLENSIVATKTGAVDPSSLNSIQYRIAIQNKANSTRTATVIDYLPDELTFLDSSHSFASYEGNVITWNLIEIEPFETEVITYKAKALRSGKVTNRAVVNPSSVSGKTARSVSVSAVVDVAPFEGEVPAPGWQPPDWGFETDENEGDLWLYTP